MPFSVAHDAMAMTGEAPLWDPDRNCLWWIDIQNQLLLCHTPGGDPVNRRIALPGLPGLTALAESGRIVVGFENGLWTWDPERETLEQFSDVESDRPNVRLNDGKPDAQGRLWFGSMDATLTRAPIGRLYRRDPDGRMVTIRDGITISNAIAIPPSGDLLYFADSPTRDLECHDLDPASGELSNARIVHSVPQGCIPDGACCDADGNIWLAVIGGSRIEHLRPDGSLIASHSLPVSRPTMPMLGGAEDNTLFVTSQRRFLDRAGLVREPLAGDLLAGQVTSTAAPVFHVAGI